MKTYMFLNLVLFYISLGFLVEKAGYKMIYGYIPILNIYYLSKTIKTNIIIFIVLILGILLLPFKNLLLTITYIYMPFIISYYFGLNALTAIFTLIIPFIGYPYMALRGSYNDGVR